MSERSCDGCTKCCEGYLQGTVKGKSFYRGSPCFFVEIGKGCSIYPERPQNPCISFKCEWLTNDDLPMWMKPSESQSIVCRKTSPSGRTYLEVVEAGEKLDTKVLSWIVKYAVENGFNLSWQFDGGVNYIGSPDFMKEMKSL